MQNKYKAKDLVNWFAILGTILVILKACNLTTISWLEATAPFWLPLAVFLAVLVVMALVALVVAIFQSLSPKNNSFRKRF